MDIHKEHRHGSPDFPIRIYTGHCSAGFQIYPHYHTEFEFLFLTEGSGVLCVDGEHRPLRQGDGAFLDSGVIHLGLAADDQPAAFCAIVFAPEIFGPLLGDRVTDRYVTPVLQKELRLPPLYTPEVPWQREVLQTAESLCALGNAPGAELETKSRLFHLWALLCAHGQPLAQRTGSRVPEIRQVMAYMEQAYPAHLTLAELAARAHMSEGYFCRSFTALTQTSPIAYLLQVRLRKSCELLTGSDQPISQIALGCGFSDFSYYTRCFRRMFGCTPSEYRKQHRK